MTTGHKPTNPTRYDCRVRPDHPAGTATGGFGSDVQAYVSRDGGASYTFMQNMFSLSPGVPGTASGVVSFGGGGV